MFPNHSCYILIFASSIMQSCNHSFSKHLTASTKNIYVFFSLLSSTQWSDLLLQRCPLLISLFYFQFHFWHFVVFSFVPCVFFFIFSYTLDRIFTKNNFINCVLSTVYYCHFFVSLYFQIFSSLVFFTIIFALFSRFLVVKVFFILFYKFPTILQYQ